MRKMAGYSLTMRNVNDAPKELVSISNLLFINYEECKFCSISENIIIINVIH